MAQKQIWRDISTWYDVDIDIVINIVSDIDTAITVVEIVSEPD